MCSKEGVVDIEANSICSRNWKVAHLLREEEEERGKRCQKWLAQKPNRRQLIELCGLCMLEDMYLKHAAHAHSDQILLLRWLSIAPPRQQLTFLITSQKYGSAPSSAYTQMTNLQFQDARETNVCLLFTAVHRNFHRCRFCE